MSRLWLFFNHADAWIVTLVVSAVSLALRGRLDGSTLGIPVMLAAGAWLAFAINDRFDAHVDASDPRKAHRSVFAGPYRRQMTAILIVAGAMVVGVFGAYGPRAWVIAAIALAAAWAYSAPPLRLKARPGWDLFAHAALVETLPYLAAIWLIDAPLTPFDALAWSALVLASLSAQLEQQIRDAAFDARFERTFTTVFGVAVSTRLLRIASVALIAIGVISVVTGITPPLLWPALLLALPMIAHRLTRPAGQPRSERLIRVLLVAGLAYAGGVVLLV
ncbi:MAG: UbiA family prenyltransferase [Chloroflexi bacterium]|nr:UbiA family prenyltransferase [Chloroflexota bacterium]